jgi:hypothetical protein
MKILILEIMKLFGPATINYYIGKFIIYLRMRMRMRMMMMQENKNKLIEHNKVQSIIH